MSARALDHACSELALPCSMETRALPNALPMSPACAPSGCGVRASCDAEKIWPTGALEKKASLKLATSGCDHRALADGKFPLFLNSQVCCSGAVSHRARSTASLAWTLAFGTARYEPPQLPPPVPGMRAMFHLPVVSGALVRM